MYIDYEWVKTYLTEAPSLEEAAVILNKTGLETEVDGNGLEIEFTVNRPDGMSHYGIARELAVKLNCDLVEPAIYEGELPALDGWEIRSEEPEHCSRYMGLKIEGVKATPSPQWLVDRLTAIDQTCHNFLVDLTNFLLWEFGHPSHAFDANKIKDQTIIVRFAKDGESLTTLDGRDHNAAGHLVIADAADPIAFGGVMGGQNSEVDEHTTELLLELACFRGSTVRSTGKKNNIVSDARHRFERGVDRERMDRVIRRFLHLLLQEQPNVKIIGFMDMDLDPFSRVTLTLRASRLKRILGIDLDPALVSSLLTRMDCRPEAVDGGWLVAIPGYKVDVTREIDVIEEVIRFAGLDLLETDLPPMGGSDYAHDPIREGEDLLRELLRGSGFQETCTYGFHSMAAGALYAPEDSYIQLRNPMTVNQAAMRRFILPNMLDCLKANLSRGIQDVKFFEVGHVFVGEQEPHHLAIALTSGKDRNAWYEQPKTHPFYQIKGVYELLCSHLGWEKLELVTKVPAWLKEGEALAIHYNGQPIGGFGVLSQKALDVDATVTVLEIDLTFLKEQVLPIPAVKELSRFPGMRYDLAFVLDSEHSVGSIQNFLNSLDIDQLENIELFDIYEGKSVGDQKRSVGFRFYFQAMERTLTTEEVQKSMDHVMVAVGEKFNATIRK